MRLCLAILLLLFMTATGQTKTLKILSLGDSLTSGYGLQPSDGFAVRLEAALRAKGHDVIVVNGGVAGDTARDGLARLDWSLGDDIDAVIVELGANDALRGLPPSQAEAALDALLGTLGKRNLAVLLAGMRAPRNLGEEYAEAFDSMYGRLAAKHGTLHYPFFLDGVAAVPSLNQADGIHPNAAGVDVIVSGILPMVEKLIGKANAN